MSKKKTLLEEGTMRRFMKLANMEVVGDSFINEMYGAKMKKDEDLDEGDRKDDDEKMRTNKPMEEDIDEGQRKDDDAAMQDDLDEGSHDMKADDPPMMGDPMQDDEEMELDVEDEKEEMDMDAGDMGELTLTDEEAEVFLKVADKVRAAMEMEAPEEMPAPDMGGDMEEPMDEPMDDMEMDAEETEEEPMMEDMVNEVARRVARRLNGLKKSK